MVSLLLRMLTVLLRVESISKYSKGGLLWKKKGGIVGLFNMVCIVLVAGYTIPVYGWIINYIIVTPLGMFSQMDSTEVADYFGTMSGNYSLILAMIALNCVLTMLVVRKNLQSGIEKIAKILLPTLAVVMIEIAVIGLLQPGAMEGVKFLFIPDFESFSGETILTALGQTFFSLGIGMAAALVFGSCQKEGELNAVKNSMIVGCVVIFVAILSGLMIFPMVKRRYQSNLCASDRVSHGTWKC